MPIKIAKNIRNIVTLFQEQFDISLLFKFCLHLYQKQSQSIKKKYANLLGILQLSAARIIKYQKQHQMLQCAISAFQQSLRLHLPILQRLSIEQLAKILQLLRRWKNVIELCLSFLKESSQQIWKHLKIPLLSHISKYYNAIQSFLQPLFSKEKPNKSRKVAIISPCCRGLKPNSAQLAEQTHQKVLPQQSVVQQKQTSQFQWQECFICQTYSMTLNRKDKKYPVKISTPKMKQKKEIKSEYSCHFQTLSQKIKDALSQAQSPTRLKTFHKSMSQKDSIPSFKPENQIENRDSVQKTQIKAARQQKLAGRHKSSIETELNLKANLQKQQFKSSNKLQEATILTTNETSSQLAYSSKSRSLLKSSKANGKNAISKHRMSKSSFGKSLIEDLQSKKSSQNKVNQKASQNKVDLTDFSKEDLQEIDQSKRNISDSDRSGERQQLQNATQQIVNQPKMLQKLIAGKEIPANGFRSSKSFKNQRYRRRFGQSENVADSLRSLDKIQNFVSGTSKQQIRKIKNEAKPSFFKAQSVVAFDDKSKQAKSKVSKMSAIKLKKFDKGEASQQLLIISSNCEPKRGFEKVPKRYPTEPQEPNCRTSTADPKQFYQILTQINLKEQSEYGHQPDYYHELFKRKYSSNQNVFDYSQDLRWKPFKIRMEAAEPELIINPPNFKKEALYFDFMSSSIKHHQGLTLGQRGFSQFL